MPKQTVHHITSADLASMFLLQADRGPRMPRAPFTGILQSGEAFFFDIFEAYRLEIIKGLSRVIIGQIGYGKSTQIKTEIKRSLELQLGRRYLIFDYKFEYDKLCEELGITPITFGEVKLNPIDPDRLDRNEQLAMLANMVQLARQEFKPLPDVEYGALSAALDQIAADKIYPTIMAVAAALRKPSQDSADALSITKERLFEMGFELSLVLDRFVGNEDLGGVFDGPTSPGFDLSGDVVVLNFSTIDESMRPLMVSVVSAWLESAWQKGNKALLFDHVILEECWEYLRHLVFARWARKGAKLQRVHGVAYTYVLHGLTDLLAAGTADSEQVRLAEGLVRDAQVVVMFLNDESERAHLARVFGLPEILLDMVTRELERGQMLWKFGNHMLIVHQLLSKQERHIVHTDAGIESKYLEPTGADSERIPALA